MAWDVLAKLGASRLQGKRMMEVDGESTHQVWAWRAMVTEKVCEGLWFKWILARCSDDIGGDASTAQASSQ